MYVARRLAPVSMAVAAFSLDRSVPSMDIINTSADYLLSRILVKICQNQTTAFSIAPVWAGLPWYPIFMLNS